MSITWAFKDANFFWSESNAGTWAAHVGVQSRGWNAHHNILLAQIFTEFHLYMLFALYRRQLEIRSRISYL